MRAVLLSLFISLLSFSTSKAESIDLTDWSNVLEEAKGQKVYWHAWGGAPRINEYISWVADELKRQFDVELEHVKIDDTANVVSRVLAEKAAGKISKGSVDLIWINGENFAAMKKENLLLNYNWATKLPNWDKVDVKGKPTVVNDFTIPTDGLESPWGMAQLVFMYDSNTLSNPPKSAKELLEWTRKNPGRFSYPQPPNFHGTTFLKQLLVELIEDSTILRQPVNQSEFDNQVKPLFDYLNNLHPNLWRSGRTFPQNSTSMRQSLADKELEISFTFNPADASNAIANNELPPTVRTFVFENGSIGNTHFVAIPFNSSVQAGALVTANFLISPIAQARKQDPKIWGDPTVLDVKNLKPEDKKLFDELSLGVATLTPEELGNVIPEPHPTWVTEIEKKWIETYGVQ